MADEARAREKVFAAALRLLSARARSEQQLRDKLLAKDWLDPTLIDDCIARLKELGYIDDRGFAMNYALSRLNLKPVGRQRLGRELSEKKISRELIDETLSAVFEEVGEDALLNRAVEKHTRLHGKPADPKGAKKLMAYLMRLGFSYDLVMKKLRAIRLAVDEEFDEER